MKFIRILLLGLGLLTAFSLQPTKLVEACGGLFCQNVPVDQAAERIIFTVDRDQISAYVQINYTGAAPDFAWVVPVPSVPEVDVAEMDSFTELQAATDPVFMLPPMPECFSRTLPVPTSSPPAAGSGGNVTVYASGTAGPYAYDVVGTESGDSNALIDWLNENSYRITPEMEPLVHVYVEESMLFLAMKLQPEQGVQDIQPVKMTYTSERPMIPLRLTAVAATPNMGVYTWIFGRARTESLNYAGFELDDNDLQPGSFFGRGTNYQQLVANEIDRYEGRAFITEYAQPTSQLKVTDPLLQALRDRFPYVTRFYGQLSPEEMTVDPVFDFNGQLADVSNIHDLTQRTDFYTCPDTRASNIEPVNDQNTTASPTPSPCVLGLAMLLSGGLIFVSRRKG